MVEKSLWKVPVVQKGKKTERGQKKRGGTGKREKKTAARTSKKFQAVKTTKGLVLPRKRGRY